MSVVQAIWKQAEFQTCPGWNISTLYESLKLPVSAFGFFTSEKERSFLDF